MRILVTGATGNVGGELVHLLRATGETVRALVRESSRAGLPPDVELALGDLDRPASLRTALAGVDGVFLLGGYGDMARVLAEIGAARTKHVVLLSSRSIVGGKPDNAIVRMWQRAEHAVSSSAVPWTILRPSGFMSNALRWAPQIRSGDDVRAPFAQAAIAAIDPFDIAAVAREVLRAPHEHASKHYTLTGPEALLPAEQLAILGDVLGRKLRFSPQPDAEARMELQRMLPADMVDAFFRFFVGGEFDDSGVVPIVHELTGTAPRTFEQWARAHRFAFAGS